MAHILIVEDEADLASLVEYNLAQEGHTIEVATTGAAAVAKAKANPPDLALVDLMLPDIPGTEVVRLIKADALTRRTQVVFVTARGEESDRVRGLELGADDYVVKPFSVRELSLRVRAVLRRAEPAGSATQRTLTTGRITLDIDRHDVTVDHSSVALTALEFRLLQTLLERRGRVQTREVLLSDVWGIHAEITTRTVDTHIKRLREKLGAAGDAIETIRGVGYRVP